MDTHDTQALARGRSLSATSTGGTSSSVGLVGLGIDPASQFPSPQPDFSGYNPNTGSFFGTQQQAVPFEHPPAFGRQLANGNPPVFGAQTQDAFLNPTFAGADISIYSSASREQLDRTTLYSDSMMTQCHGVTPPHLLKPEPGSANHSPNFSQHRFTPARGRHSRNASLGPEAALLPVQADWSHGQFQGHRRSPSEYSDVSSAAQSPNLHSLDSLEQAEPSHSPMQRAQDPAVYQELHGLGTFTLSEHGTHSPSPRGGRSPSHSPAISPRILPQQMPDMNQQNNFILQPSQHNGLGPGPFMQAAEAFPQFHQEVHGIPDGMPAPPSINIDYAPAAIRHGFEQPKSLDVDSLTPPESRGKSISTGGWHMLTWLKRANLTWQGAHGSGHARSRTPITAAALC